MEGENDTLPSLLSNSATSIFQKLRARREDEVFSAVPLTNRRKGRTSGPPPSLDVTMQPMDAPGIHLQEIDNEEFDNVCDGTATEEQLWKLPARCSRPWIATSSPYKETNSNSHKPSVDEISVTSSRSASPLNDQVIAQSKENAAIHCIPVGDPPPSPGNATSTCEDTRIGECNNDASNSSPPAAELSQLARNLFDNIIKRRKTQKENFAIRQKLHNNRLSPRHAKQKTPQSVEEYDSGKSSKYNLRRSMRKGVSIVKQVASSTTSLSIDPNAAVPGIHGISQLSRISAVRYENLHEQTHMRSMEDELHTLHKSPEADLPLEPAGAAICYSSSKLNEYVGDAVDAISKDDTELTFELTTKDGASNNLRSFHTCYVGGEHKSDSALQHQEPSRTIAKWNAINFEHLGSKDKAYFTGEEIEVVSPNRINENRHDEPTYDLDQHADGSDLMRFLYGRDAIKGTKNDVGDQTSIKHAAETSGHAGLSNSDVFGAPQQHFDSNIFDDIERAVRIRRDSACSDPGNMRRVNRIRAVPGGLLEKFRKISAAQKSEDAFCHHALRNVLQLRFKCNIASDMTYREIPFDVITDCEFRYLTSNIFTGKSSFQRPDSFEAKIAAPFLTSNVLNDVGKGRGSKQSDSFMKARDSHAIGSHPNSISADFTTFNDGSSVNAKNASLNYNYNLILLNCKYIVERKDFGTVIIGSLENLPGDAEMVKYSVESEKTILIETERWRKLAMKLFDAPTTSSAKSSRHQMYSTFNSLGLVIPKGINLSNFSNILFPVSFFVVKTLRHSSITHIF